MNPYVISGSKSQPTPVSTVNTPLATAISVFNTPKKSQEFRTLCGSIVSSNASGATMRLLFQKVANGLDNRNTKLAEAEMKIQQLERRIELMQPKKRRKVKESANEKFVRIIDVMAVKSTLPALPDSEPLSPEGSIVLDSIIVATGS